MSIRRRRFPIAVAAITALAAASLVSAKPADAGCSMVPRPECRVLEQSRFEIDSYGHVLWRATRGPSTTVEEFGDPDETSHYFLCAWDENGLLVAADIPPGSECPGGSCWCSVDSGLRYTDESGSNSDLRLLELTGSDAGRTKVRAETLVIGGINLPVTGDLLIQLARADSEICFESLLTADEFTTNNRESAAAKSVAE